jgi:hypothetical protein
MKKFLKDAGVEWATVRDLGYGKYKIIIRSDKEQNVLMNILREMSAYLHVDNFQIYFKKRSDDVK